MRSKNSLHFRFSLGFWFSFFVLQLKGTKEEDGEVYLLVHRNREEIWLLLLLFVVAKAIHRSQADTEVES